MRTATGSLGEGGGHSEPQQDSTAPPEVGSFFGSDNPRHLRALAALLRRPMPREHLDLAAGCSNGPDLVSELRNRGLALPCDRTPVVHRDGPK